MLLAPPPTRVRSQAVRFVTVGLAAAVIDYLTYRMVLESGLAVTLAKAIAFVVGTGFSYWANRRWTFEAHHSVHAMARFAALYGLTLVVNVGVNALVLALLPTAVGAITAAWVVAQGVTSTLNFVAARRYVFSGRGARPAPEEPRVRPAPAAGGWPGLIALVAVGWLAVWSFGHLADVAVTRPAWREGLPLGAAAVTCVVGGAIAWTSRRHPRVAADLVVAATAVGVSGLATLGLHGTRWGMSALYADAAFRTEAVTRFAGTPELLDHAYLGLPAHYPPALPWVQGRLADLVDVPGWQIMKPTEIVLYAAIPLLAYALWRRLLAPWPAALAVAASTLATIDLEKPDEALALACLLPWWCEVVRAARRADARAWPVWAHGLVLGLLLLVHTYYFLPLFLASLLALALDLVRQRRPRLPVPRALAILGTGLLVSAVYWGPLALARLRGRAWDDLQLRFSHPHANLPPLPVPGDPMGMVGAVGIIWLAYELWPGRPPSHGRRVAGALATALAGGYLTLAVGALAQRADIGFLSFKSEQLVIAVQVIAAALGLHAAARAVARRPGPVSARLRVLAAGTAVAIAAPAVGVFACAWAVGGPSTAAQTTRYPSGGWPEGRHGMPAHPSPRNVQDGDPSVREVLAAWESLSGRQADEDTVLVTSQVDLLATHPVHPFLTWKSIYSNPLGQFGQRHHLLEEVARSTSSASAAARLRENPYDRVDGLVLRRSTQGYRLPLAVDDFPHRTRPASITFDPEIFASPEFRVRRLGSLVVIVLAPRARAAATG